MIILGTAGHVDHGKSSLIHALTGIAADQLQLGNAAEKSADLGYAVLNKKGAKGALAKIAVVDMPGHERFIKNMLAGATGIDALLLVVAADEGVKAQTREHLQIAELLGIPALVVALTKTDRLTALGGDSAAVISKRTQEIRDLLKKTPWAKAEIIPCSIHDDASLKQLEKTLWNLGSGVLEQQEQRQNRPFRMWIDRAFEKPGRGSVVTGSSVSGAVQANDAICIYGQANQAAFTTPAKVTKVEAFLKEIPVGQAGMRLALHLEHSDGQSLERGHCIATPETLAASDSVFVYLSTLSSAPLIKHNSAMKVYFGTQESRCRVLSRGWNTQELPPAQFFAELKFEQPVFLKRGDRLVLRFESPSITAAGASVLLCAGEYPHSIRPEAADLQVLQKTPTNAVTPELLEVLVKLAGRHGTSTGRLANILSISVKECLPLITAAKETLRTFDKKLSSESLVIASGAWESMTGQIVGELMHQLERQPAATAIHSETLRSKIAKHLSPEIFALQLAQISKLGKIEVDKSGAVALVGYVANLKKNDPEVSATQIQPAAAPKAELPNQLIQIATSVAHAGITPPTIAEIAALTRIPPKIVTTMVQSLQREGVLVRLPDDLIVHHQTLTDLQEKLSDYFGKQSVLTMAQFKDMIGTSRKYCVPFLEYFDSIKVTLRTPSSDRTAGPRLTEGKA